MTIAGFRQAGTLDLLATIEEAAQSAAWSSNSARRRQQIKAQAYAQVCHANGVGVNEMTPAMRAYADTVARMMGGEGEPEGRGYGFRLPGVNERRPNFR